jgi:hypothetical protein
MDLRLALRIAIGVFAVASIVVGLPAFLRALRWRRGRGKGGPVDNITTNYLSWMFFFLGSCQVLSAIFEQDFSGRVYLGVTAILVFSGSVLSQMPRRANLNSYCDRTAAEANSAD